MVKWEDFFARGDTTKIEERQGKWKKIKPGATKFILRIRIELSQ